MAENGYYSINDFPGNGTQTTFEVSFAGGYISRDHITGRLFKDSDRTYVDVTFEWVNSYTIRVAQPVPVGYTLRMYRSTPINAPLVDYSDGALLNEVNLDTANRQAIFAAAEAADAFGTVPGNDALRDAVAALAFARSRSNHTGTQPISSVAELQSVLDAKAPNLFRRPGGSSLSIASIVGSYAVTPEQFGAKGDGVTDDSAAINRAAKFIADSMTPGILHWGFGSVYRCDSTITLNTMFVSTSGYGVFDFTRLTSNVAVDLVSTLQIVTNPALYKVRRSRIGGMTVTGPARVGSKIAFRVGPTPNLDTYNTQFEISDIAINTFGNGVVFLEHVYCMEVRRFMMSGVDRCFFKGQGIDAGERIKIADGTMSACGTNFHIDDVSADFFVSNVSCDYNEAPEGSVGRCWVKCDSGIIKFHHSHFEGGRAGNPMGPGAMFQQGAGNTAEIEVVSSVVIGAEPIDGVYLFTNANPEKPITFKMVNLLRVLGVNRVFGTGRAICDFIYINGGGDHTNALITSAMENMNPDTFFGSAPASQFSITAGGNGTKNGSASSGAMSMSTSNGRLKLRKAPNLGMGAAAAASFVTPCYNSQGVAGCSMNLIKDGAAVGNLIVSLDWASGYKDGNGVWIADPLVVNCGTFNLSLTSPAGAYPIMLGASNRRRPSWATHLVVSFILSNVDTTPTNPGTIDISQFIVTTSRGN